MLPDISLDDERFEELLERARRMIPGLYPEWTDYNYHDPGITMLEMLAWLKETQQFHMDQIGERHILRYCKLLGVKPKHRLPAKAIVSVVMGTRSGWVLKGSRFQAFPITFEACAPRYLEKTDIGRFLVTDDCQGKEAAREYPLGKRDLHIPLFGKKPRPKAAFALGFLAPLHREQEHRIYFKLYRNHETIRNPIGRNGKFLPLSRVEMEVYGKSGFCPVRKQRDGTHGFLEDGFFCFQLGSDMEADREGWYWLRIVLEEADYDIPPVLEQFSFHELEVRQTHTLSEWKIIEWKSGEIPMIETDTFLGAWGEYELYVDGGDGFRQYKGPVKRQETGGRIQFILTGEADSPGSRIMLLCYEQAFGDVRFLGKGDGFPNQEIDTEMSGLCAEGLELLVETEMESGIFIHWYRREDFSDSGPEDCCFVFDEAAGRMYFGDGFHGRVPEGRILLAAGHTSLGAGGNVRSDTIQGHETHMDFVSVRNPTGAVGGCDPETADQCRVRLRRELKRTERAVTYEDFEKLVMRTPGLMIEKVRAIPVSQRKRPDGTVDETTVALVVKPRSLNPRPELSHGYVQNIRRMLEPRRMIGTSFKILSPEYVGITIFAEIETDGFAQTIKQELKEALSRYFDRQENDFGQRVLYGAIYGILDVAEHVTRVKSVSLDAQGNGVRRSRNGDILLPVHGLAYLKEWDCMMQCTQKI